MSDVTERQGHCLCNAIQVTAKSASCHLGACHCAMCRRWGGGPYMTIDCGAEVAIDGEENLSVFDSSPWAERGFCRQCGTHLFYRLKESRQHFMPMGLFDGTEKLAFDHQVFIDEKPDVYEFANKTKDMTGTEIFAMYGSSE